MYPEIAKTKVKAYPDFSINYGEYVPKKRGEEAATIYLNRGLSPDNTVRTIIHEVQHYIQNLEKWPEQATANRLSPTSPYREYKSQFHEHEARSSQERAFWSKESRKRWNPYTMERKPKGGWILE